MVKQIKHIIFDWGGVIEVGSFFHASYHLHKKYKINIEEFKIDTEKVGLNYQCGKEETPFFELMSKKYNIPIQELKDTFNGVYYKEHIKDLLSKLQQNHSIHLLSNQMNYRANFLREHRDLTYFSNVFFSNEIGFAKPDPQAFMYVLKKINAKPEDCLFIDDTIENVNAAKAIGIDAIHFENIPLLIKELQQRSLLQKEPFIINSNKRKLLNKDVKS